MKIDKKGSAVWQGGLKDGKGELTTESGALSSYPYGFNTRFEGKKGSNPEELIGAALAGCFSMAMSKALGDSGYEAKRLDTVARVTLEQDGDGFSITKILLSLNADIPEIDQAKFDEVSQAVKAACPVSKLLKAEITLDAKLNA